MTKWKKTNFPGVRYREHETRKNGVKRDQYFTIRYKMAGKDREEGLGWASEDWTAAKAYDHLKELKANRKSGEGPQTLAEKREIADARKEAERDEQERQKREAVTFGCFFTETYLPQARADKKKMSVAREEGLFNIWINPLLGQMPLKNIAPFNLEKLKKVMSEGKQSPRSVGYALAVIRQVFNSAKRAGVYEGELPTAKVKFPKLDNGRMRFMTREEARRLLDALMVKSVDVHDMALLSLHSGLRLGEITSLTWQDVDLKKEILTIRDAKAGSRYAFLTRQAGEMLKNRPQGPPSSFVFQNRKGDKIESISHTFNRIIGDLNLNAGIDDPRLRICFHSCRHTYASWLVEQGQDLYTVQKLLGHKTAAMTQRYAHLAENKLKDAAMALSRSLQAEEDVNAEQLAAITK